MRIFPLIIVALCVAMQVRAQSGNNSDTQDPNFKRWKKGFVVAHTNDTMRGKILVNDFLDVYYDYQRKVSFKDHSGTIVQYIPDQLHSFSYYEDLDSQMLTLQSVSSPEGDGHVFLKLYCAGTCKVYGYTVTELKSMTASAETGPVNSYHSSLIPTEKKYIQLRGSEFFPLRMIGFRKNMKEFFAECPLLISKLESKAYTYTNWKALVQDYNCGICK